MMMYNRVALASSNKTVPENFTFFYKLIFDGLDFICNIILVFVYSI